MHLLKRRVRLGVLEVGRLVLLDLGVRAGQAAATQLPEDEPERVDVGHLEGGELVGAEGAGEELGRHVAAGADAGVDRDVDLVLFAVVLDGQAKVRDAASACVDKMGR